LTNAIQTLLRLLFCAFIGFVTSVIFVLIYCQIELKNQSDILENSISSIFTMQEQIIKNAMNQVAFLDFFEDSKKMIRGKEFILKKDGSEVDFSTPKAYYKNSYNLDVQNNTDFLKYLSNKKSGKYEDNENLYYFRCVSPEIVKKIYQTDDCVYLVAMISKNYLYLKTQDRIFENTLLVIFLFFIITLMSYLVYKKWTERNIYYKELQFIEKIFLNSKDQIILFDAFGMIIKNYGISKELETYSYMNDLLSHFVDVDSGVYGIGMHRKVLSKLKLSNYWEVEVKQLDEENSPYKLFRFLRLNSKSIKNAVYVLIITDMKIEQELIKSNNELRNLYLNLENIREEERKRIAIKVHDELGQIMTVLSLDLKWIRNNIVSDKNLLYEKLDEMQNILKSGLDAVKKISLELRPEVLRILGLEEAIEWQLNEFEKRTSIKANTDISKPDGFFLNEEIKLLVFRIIQELLTNIIRHSKATEIYLTLKIDYKKIFISLHDNGMGIDKKNIKNSSLGLLGIKERLKPYNGKFDIIGEEEGGTTARLSIPIKNNWERLDD